MKNTITKRTAVKLFGFTPIDMIEMTEEHAELLVATCEAHRRGVYLTSGYWYSFISDQWEAMDEADKMLEAAKIIRQRIVDWNRRTQK